MEQLQSRGWGSAGGNGPLAGLGPTSLSETPAEQLNQRLLQELPLGAVVGDNPFITSVELNARALLFNLFIITLLFILVQVHYAKVKQGMCECDFPIALEQCASMEDTLVAYQCKTP